MKVRILMSNFEEKAHNSGNSDSFYTYNSHVSPIELLLGCLQPYESCNLHRKAGIHDGAHCIIPPYSFILYATYV